MAEGVKQIKDITISYAASGAAGYFWLLTDMPTGPIALRYQGALATGTGRQTVTFDVEASGDVHGKLVQYKAGNGAGGVLQLFSGKIRFRTIGVYLTGDDVWISQPMTLGSA